jgi:hypothetical protein
LSTDITPIDNIEAPIGDFLGGVEIYAKRQRELHPGRQVTIVGLGEGGQALAATSNSNLGVGGATYNSAITKANAAVAGVLAAYPDDVLMFTMFFNLGWNDSNLDSSSVAVFNPALAAVASGMRSAIKTTGTGGSTGIGTDARLIVCGFPMERRSIGSGSRSVDEALRKTAAEDVNGFYVEIPSPPNYLNTGDNIHLENTGQRFVGTKGADIQEDTTPPTILNPTTINVFEGIPFEWQLEADEYAYFSLTGADAARFEAPYLQDLRGLSSGSNVGFMEQYLRFASNGTKTWASPDDANADCAYQFNLVATDGAGNQTIQPTTLNLLRALGQPGTVAAYGGSGYVANPPTTASPRDRANRPYFPQVRLKGGMLNWLYVYTYHDPDFISDVRVLGNLSQAVHTNPSQARQKVLLVWAPNDGDYDLYFEGGNGYESGSDNVYAIVSGAVSGVVTTPDAVSWLYGESNGNNPAAPSLTCPTNGIIVGGGITTARGSVLSGATELSLVGEATAFAASRTTTGQVGFNASGSTYHHAFAMSFVKA